MPAPTKYPDGLRERGIRLALESHQPISRVAKDLGIQRESLRRWVRQAEADEGQRADLLTSNERERLYSADAERHFAPAVTRMPCFERLISPFASSRRAKLPA